MKKTLMTSFLLLAGSLAVAVAQDQPQTDPMENESSQMSTTNQTITGCLQRGSEPNTYVLSNAAPGEMGQQSSQGRDYENQDQSAAQGESTQRGNYPSEMARTENSYELVPDAKIDLKSHIGQRVEVTGKVISTTSRTTQSSRATTPSGQSSSIHSSTEMSGQPQFKVSSIRQIGQSCQ